MAVEICWYLGGSWIIGVAEHTSSEGTMAMAMSMEASWAGGGMGGVEGSVLWCTSE